MSLNELKTIRGKLDAVFADVSSDYGCIGYLFDNGVDGMGTGFSCNADQGDAMMAIKRIAEHFGIDLYTLAKVLGTKEEN